MEAAGSDELLGMLIRLIGLLWTGGAVFLVVQLRREAMMDGMLSQLTRMTDHLQSELGENEVDDAPRDARKAALEAWENRDDRSRRRWLGAQSVLLAATGLAMAALHVWASYLVAMLIGAQGMYFIVRERAARSAPTPELAAGARPSQSTVNAGWFSLAAGALVWTAHARGLLLESVVARALAPDLHHASLHRFAPSQTWTERQAA